MAHWLYCPSKESWIIEKMLRFPQCERVPCPKKPQERRSTYGQP